MSDIENARILILATNGFEQLELTVPRDELRKAGAKVDVATLDGKTIRGWNVKDWGAW
jgi:protease I